MKRQGWGQFAALGMMMSLLVATSGAENWPAWRGPQGNGISGDPNPPLKWSETENVVWKAPLKGSGSSTPVIWNDWIFLTSQTDDENEWVIGLDRSSGRTLWEDRIGNGMHKTRHGANMASPSPVTDGEVVAVAFGTGQLAAYDMRGHRLWLRNLEKDHGAFTIWWGYSNSPVLHGDNVYVTVMNEGPSYLLALDKRTGRTKWKTERRTPATSEACDSYATPLIYEVGGTTEIFLAGATWATGYDIENGKMLWRADLGGNRIIVGPTFQDGVLYVTSGMRGPLFAIRPGGRGDVSASSEHVLWKFPRSTPDVPCPLGWGDYVYFVNDSGMALCLTKNEGKMVWQERIGGDYKASPILADGKIYLMNRDGETTIIDASPRFTIHGVNSIDEGTSMASLALSDGQLFIRGMKHLYCIGRIK